MNWGVFSFLGNVSKNCFESESNLVKDLATLSAIDALSAAPIQPLAPNINPNIVNNPHQQQQDNGVWLIVIVFGYIFGLFLIFVIIWFIWYGTSIKRTNAYNRRLRNVNGTLNSGQTASTHHFYDYSSQSSLNRPLSSGAAATTTAIPIPTAGTQIVNPSPNCSYSPVAIRGAKSTTAAAYSCNRDEAVVVATALYHSNQQLNHHHHHPHLHHHHHHHPQLHNSSSGSSNMMQHSSSNNQFGSTSTNNPDDLTSSHSTSFIHSSYQHRI